MTLSRSPVTLHWSPLRLSPPSRAAVGLFPFTYQDFLTHLLPPALSLSPESSAAPPTPTRYQYPRAITNPGGLDFGFPIVPAGPSLSMANSTWGGCKLASPHTPSMTRTLTLRRIVLPQFPPLNPSYFDSSLFDPITVRVSTVSGSVISLHDFVGFRAT